jgi:sporulation protein YlmC with PRC-barrel domain
MDTAPPARPQTPQALRSADRLIGWTVEDRRGCVLGTVRELLLDLDTGRLAYAVVASGGFVGQGETRFALAWDGLEAADRSHRFIWHGPAPSGARAAPAH